MRPHLLSLLERLEAGADRPFLAGPSGAVTAGGFAARVRALAARWRSEGLQPGDRVVLHLEKDLAAVQALWAAALAGGVAVPAHPRLKDDQLRHLLADAGPWAVVTSRTKRTVLRDAEAVFGGLRVLEVGAEPGPADPPSPPPADPDRPAVLLYTGGSTGPPKGIVQTHRNLVDGARIVGGVLGLRQDDRILAVLPLSFDYGLNQVLGGAWAGATVVLRDVLGGADLVAAVAASRATVLAGVPTLWHDLAAELTRDPDRAAACTSLRVLTNTGGRLPRADLAVLRERLPPARVFAMYGLTEAFRSSILDPDLLDAHPDSVGTAVPGVELLLVDPDTGAVLEGPATGELVHAGAFVARGYWRRPEDTARRFRPDPRGGGRTVVFSGDLLRRDERGLLYFVARRDGQLKVDGHRLAPEEVTGPARACEGVEDAAVVGCDGGARGHRLVLVVADGGRGDGDLGARVRRTLRRRLPPHLVPSEVRVVDALPRTHHGKIDGTALRRSCCE